MSNPSNPSRRQTILLAAAFGAIGLIAPFASNGTVVLLLLGVLAVPVLTRTQALSWPFIDPLLGGGLMALVAWSMVSTLWAPGPSFTSSLRTALVILAGLVLVKTAVHLDAITRRRAQIAVMVGILAAMFFFAFELATSAAITRMLRGIPLADFDAPVGFNPVSRGTAVLALVLWPAVAVLWRLWGKPAWGIMAIAAAATVALLLPMLAGFLAIAVGAVTFALAYRFRRATLAVMAAAFVAYAVAAPVLSTTVLGPELLAKVEIGQPLSWEHRLGIWRHVAGKALERPWRGHGFDASRYFGRAGVTVQALNKEDRFDALPLHPHNAVLQLWLELGIIGIAAFLLIFAGVVRTIWRLGGHAIIGAAATASLASYLTVALLSFGVWQSWWHATAWLGAGALVIVGRHAMEPGPSAACARAPGDSTT